MRQRRIRAWALSVLVAVGMLGMPGGAWGQGVVGPAVQAVADPPMPREAGTAAEFVLAIPAFVMQPIPEHAALVQSANRQRYCTEPCQLLATVNLPSGALITGLEVDGYDNTDTAAIHANLGVLPIGTDGFGTHVAVASTGQVETPGTTQVRANVEHTVDNGRFYYILIMQIEGGFETRLLGVRIYYRLQVSPAPAVANFGDVPTSHPFFRFIEALKASGITGGCNANPPLFCPDAPLTRGQMATFLAIALGLHFAP
jgi:hypothetical protein